MEQQKGRCHVCGNAMFIGSAYVLGGRVPAELNWVSREKITYCKKSRLTGNEKEVNERMTFKLLSANILSSVDSEVEAWYCPNCEKVFASFDVKRER